MLQCWDARYLFDNSNNSFADTANKSLNWYFNLYWSLNFHELLSYVCDWVHILLVTAHVQEQRFQCNLSPYISCGNTHTRAREQTAGQTCLHTTHINWLSSFFQGGVIDRGCQGRLVMMRQLANGPTGNEGPRAGGPWLDAALYSVYTELTMLYKCSTLFRNMTESISWNLEHQTNFICRLSPWCMTWMVNPLFFTQTYTAPPQRRPTGRCQSRHAQKWIPSRRCHRCDCETYGSQLCRRVQQTTIPLLFRTIYIQVQSQFSCSQGMDNGTFIGT